VSSARPAALLAALAALAGATGARADVRIEGHGSGHGAGLAQYGARGYAQEEHRGFRWILAHYYPGTRIAAMPGRQVRVRLKLANALRVASVARATGSGGRTVALAPARSYKLLPWRADGVRIVDAAGGRTRSRMVAPVRLSPGRKPVAVYGRAENGVRDGRYRGTLALARVGSGLLAVNQVGLERYLYGVVPEEMFASWPAAALRAQAVAARSYALTTRRPDEPFDVFADTRSQVYGGIAGEAERTTAAVRYTRRLAVLYRDAPIRALFHASSGGRTAAVEEVFASPPLPYLLAVDDPYDRLSPFHDWTITLTDAELERRLGSLIPGELTGLAVTAVTPTGRAATIQVGGTLGTVDVDATAVRRKLDLRSTWFSFSAVPGIATVDRPGAGRAGRP
jgi:stage II sporulation protein D